MIDKIIEIEWDMFQSTNNKGGRAACQDNFPTFNIMRRAQFMSWPTNIVESYYNDILEAKSNDKNLLMEKYLRMMEYSSPEEYNEKKGYLTVLTDYNKKLVNDLTNILIDDSVNTDKKHPSVTQKGRPIYSKDDNNGLTSIQTYLKGELSTYSIHTLELLDTYVRSLLNKGLSYNELVLENTSKLYGFNNLKELEEKVNGNS